MMNRALIDTDILSYYFKGDKTVVENFEIYLQHYDFIEISLITYYEIIGGLLAKNALKQLRIFDEFLMDNLVIPLTESSVKISAELYSTLTWTSQNQPGKLVTLLNGTINRAIQKGDILCTFMLR